NPIDPVLIEDRPGALGAFTTGSTMRHVLVMTAAGSVGLIAVFFVDLLSLLYISRLGDTSLTAAVGYASQVLFLLISVNIGLSIAIGAVVSRALGAGDRPRARHLAVSGLLHVAVISGTLSLLAWPFAHDILRLFGAQGEALEVGTVYLRMTLPASVFLGVGMAFASILRAVGDAKRSMYVTLGGAIITACLDPIFIFGFHLGIYGAAIVLVASRFVLLLVGWHGAVRVHDLVAKPHLRPALLDLAPLMTIAIPAILTNLANPVANIYAMRIFSRFGQETVAAFAIMDRVTPVAFGVLFALSGSVGPVLGQNYGARIMGRVRRVLTDCLIVSIVYVVVITVVLWLAAPLIIALFGATGETAKLLGFFCTYGGGLWFFLGGIFVANAAYNNLGAPFMSAVFNWGRATLGTMPFVTIGAAQYGPEGGFIGMIAGAALFGTLAVGGAYVVIARLSKRISGQPDDVIDSRKALNA
ncbi:MATE family efflux transporter, partial [Beijerinckia sp. L45]|uniref:MATE family efflux transporter n=1 Tax=Beijerinckia sp. L45 TaxID=1641855 RepID=UPI0034CFE188